MSLEGPDHRPKLPAERSLDSEESVGQPLGDPVAHEQVRVMFPPQSTNTTQTIVRPPTMMISV